jgi:hypothetical protein
MTGLIDPARGQPMSLIDFYLELGMDVEGRRLSEILALTDEEMEFAHDFIYWLFPLPEASHFNWRAPVLTHQDIAAFKREPCLRTNLLRSFDRFLAFLGLTRIKKVIVERSNFDARQPNIWAHPNHNWRRVTRVLASMPILGCQEEARLLYQWLRCYDDRYYRQMRKPSPFDWQTMQRWLKAVNWEEQATAAGTGHLLRHAVEPFSVRA